MQARPVQVIPAMATQELKNQERVGYYDILEEPQHVLLRQGQEMDGSCGIVRHWECEDPWPT